jgi:arylsulfotransferase ASST
MDMQLKYKMRILVAYVMIGIFLFSSCSSISAVNYFFDNNYINPENKEGDISIEYNEHTCDGYMICSIVPFMLLGDSHHALLIDMDGNEVNKWYTIPDPVKMLPGGSIISATGEYIDSWDSTNLTQLSWNGTIEWNFNGWDDDGTGTLMAREHHDFQREGNPVGYYAPEQDFLPNGNTLILAHKTVMNKSISWKPIIDDVIYEVNWNGTLTGFEWHASEHINQMGFTEKERKSIWLNPGGPGILLGCLPGDWIHINSVSLLGKNQWYESGDDRFHPNNLIISSRHASFIAIIDHNTGDIIWRIGPHYAKDSEEGQKLGEIIGPHHAHIIPFGLPGSGNIIVFDNGGIAGYGFLGFPSQFRLYSRVIEFNPITFEIEQEYMKKTGIIRLVRQGDYHRFYSPTLCNVQRLPNGNTLVTEGLSGKIFEITPENMKIWEWVTPDKKDFIYRAYRVPPEWVPGNPAGYELWENI